MLKLKLIKKNLCLCSCVICLVACASNSSVTKSTDKNSSEVVFRELLDNSGQPYKIQKNISAAEPSWVKKPQTGANEALYLCGTGSGITLEDASNNAISAIAKYIRQNIDSQTITTDYSANLNGEFTSKTTLDEIIKTQSVVDNLVGVKIKEYWQDKNNRFYALGVLNKSEASIYYSKKIQEIDSVIVQLINDSEEKSFEGYFAIKKACIKAKELLNYLDILYAVDKISYETYNCSFGSYELLEKQAKDYANKIAIKVSIDGDENGRVKGSFVKVFNDQGFVITDKDDQRYQFNGNLNFETSILGKNTFVRYLIDAVLMDKNTGKIIVPFTMNGREGHLTELEAKNRCLRVLEKNIQTKFAQDFSDFIEKN